MPFAPNPASGVIAGAGRALVVRGFAPLCFAFACATAAGAEFAFGDYVPSSITQENAAYHHDPHLDVTIEAGNYKYRVRVTYLGQVREVGTPLAGFLDVWAASLGKSQVRPLLQHEILVREGPREYWLVIQDQLLAPLRSEVAAGGEVDLYIMRLGSMRSGPIYVVNEFQRTD